MSLVRVLDALSSVQAHDAKLDQLETLSKLARARLRFWRSFGVISAGAALILGAALWNLAQNCECSRVRRDDMMRF
jgi:predicted ATP-grasp superfamily ATP-dependent carboligase